MYTWYKFWPQGTHSLQEQIKGDANNGDSKWNQLLQQRLKSYECSEEKEITLFGKWENLQEQAHLKIFRALNRFANILKEKADGYSRWETWHDQSSEDWKTYWMNGAYWLSLSAPGIRHIQRKWENNNNISFEHSNTTQLSSTEIIAFCPHQSHLNNGRY